jgi:hypothetical protein
MPLGRLTPSIERGQYLMGIEKKWGMVFWGEKSLLVKNIKKERRKVYITSIMGKSLAFMTNICGLLWWI